MIAIEKLNYKLNSVPDTVYNEKLWEQGSLFAIFSLFQVALNHSKEELTTSSSVTTNSKEMLLEDSFCMYFLDF